MKHKHPLKVIRNAIFSVALGLVFISASAQFSLSSGTGKASTSVHTEQVQAELLAWAPEGVAAGKPVWLGLQLAHQPGWHTYWLNPGDSGLPTQLNWQLPAGLTAGAIAWPKPHKIPIGNLANYGYEGTVLLPVPLTVSPDFSAPELHVSLQATWLVCRTECIPQEGQFTLKLPSQGSTTRDGALFQATLDATPRVQGAGDSQVTIEPAAIALRLAGLPAAWQGQALQFYPETGGVIETAAPWQQAWQGAVWTAQIPLSAQRSASPATMPLVVALDSGLGLRLDVPVKGVWPALANTALPPALETALRANAAAGVLPVTATGALPTGLWAACLGALLGGLILNLMPCVFPVLAIKVVGFVQVKDRAARWRHALAYSLGVVLSFLALGGLLLVLRGLGEQLGWGFQLQSPTVVAALAVLFTLLGLNLAGLFEFGTFLPSRLAAWQAKNPSVDAFLSGVLATAVASPCTAPFMGASLGYAIALPALQALAVFGAIGVGMALPYVVLSTAPALARALPQPGPWMLRFKQLMAFPMFVTVVWLVWVLGQQSGLDGAGALLLLLVLLAWVLWSWTLRGIARGLMGSLSLAALLWATLSLGPTMMATPASSPSAASAVSGPWQTWEPGRVEQLTAQGQNVFVDFTAAWCVTCQYNKKTTLSDSVLMAEMAAQNIALLRADWTRRDPAVTAALTQLGRSGVPVYVLYAPGQAPVLLSEILSVQEVRAVVARLKNIKP